MASPQTGQVWRDDLGTRFKVVTVEDGWVYLKHPDTPKKHMRKPASYEVPVSHFERGDWTLVGDG